MSIIKLFRKIYERKKAIRLQEILEEMERLDLISKSRLS